MKAIKGDAKHPWKKSTDTSSEGETSDAFFFVGSRCSYAGGTLRTSSWKERVTSTEGAY